MEDLFGAGRDGGAAVEDDNDAEDAVDGGPARRAASPRSPLAVRMRPRTLDDVVGQQHLLGQGSPLRQLAAGTDATGPAGPSSLILWGPPGTGKTTLAHVIAKGPGRKFVELSAITAGVKDVRRVMEEALTARDLFKTTTVLFLDEIHRFNKAQQDALLPGVENRWVVLVAATTENPSFSVVSPLLSRSLLLTLKPLTDADVEGLLLRAAADPRGLGGKVELTDAARGHLVRLSGGDARRALTALEAAAGVAYGDADDADTIAGTAGPAPVQIELKHTERALDVASVRYDRAGDQHYDVASAFIKSIRGSDVDAALHYLARMLEAGEDPRFVARRIVISAAEDVGMADPTALQTAVAAAQAVQLIGMPEGRIILAEAVVHLATAPKSNAAYLGINQAIADVRAGLGNGIPAHLRDAHYPGSKQLGHGQGYKYAHDAPHSVATQQYPPDDLVGRNYYEPTGNGAERDISTRLERLRRIIRGK
ncbi:replication-associated recombination protein A [Arthrobacter sp. AL08]|uniref:replication-associated recombination protein A n=1 Tax=Micrococcaceae TaxID=1268 RepID=UPI001CFF8195|nr:MULTISPECIES: replication-associated recombination protein A [Micrococcaceae]MCB5282522.1 putative AAA domain-containing protein [Arthrobacter sp. ES1]MDI3242849.1 replication-associated recombination protein A [Arthrobacter sp. AL05]MDI3278888.1 replication-associated recombination protein A [Arthrobacter sp. AL08]MDJ0351619.1 replication-associated recombination protein A [Pseudarthrobacter sp. PH31-O2]WGZ81240.1 replication-associated recombination protein A [Arthrobacter sp. EM1]